MKPKRKEIPYSEWDHRVGALYSVDGSGDAGLHNDLDTLLDEVSGSVAPDPVRAPLYVAVYAPKPIKSEFVISTADALLDAYRDEWNEEYGGSDFADDAEDGSVYHELHALVHSWVIRSKPWQCDPTGEVLVFSAADLRELYEGDDVEVVGE